MLPHLHHQIAAAAKAITCANDRGTAVQEYIDHYLERKKHRKRVEDPKKVAALAQQLLKDPEYLKLEAADLAAAKGTDEPLAWECGRDHFAYVLNKATEAGIHGGFALLWHALRDVPPQEASDCPQIAPQQDKGRGR